MHVTNSIKILTIYIMQFLHLIIFIYYVHKILQKGSFKKLPLNYQNIFISPSHINSAGPVIYTFPSMNSIYNFPPNNNASTLLFVFPPRKDATTLAHVPVPQASV